MRGGSKAVESFKSGLDFSTRSPVSFSDCFLTGLEKLRIFELFGRLQAFCGLFVSSGIEFLFQGIHGTVQEGLQEIHRLLRLLKEVQSRIPKGFPGVNVVAKCNRAVSSGIGEDVSAVTLRICCGWGWLSKYLGRGSRLVDILSQWLHSGRRCRCWLCFVISCYGRRNSDLEALQWAKRMGLYRVKILTDCSTVVHGLDRVSKVDAFVKPILLYVIGLALDFQYVAVMKVPMQVVKASPSLAKSVMT
ncbi:hypothetical protein RHGRI_028296 [Rhododendron griersonianum]|uniref:RNase H type-1 domain-containing protein n=1 Tax=Rhododendron griersonianum TaxID=479676 RepID=A0AAV6IFY7_9ERIC|nr:hypothetical protein RHGRI_028296 [Rhododendron griersonianum]